MKIGSETKTHALTNLQDYFPNQADLYNCFEEIQSITDSYNRASDLDGNTPFNNQDAKWYKKHKKRNKHSNKFNFDKAISKVKILEEFTKGLFLTQLQLLGVATNMYWITGGLKWMKKIMTEHNQNEITDYTDNDFNILKYLRKKNKNFRGGYFKPMPLALYSPHTNDHHYKSIYTSVRIPNGFIRIISKPELVGLPETERKFKEKFTQFLNDNSNRIYLFKCPTALGKTRRLHTLEGATISLPTHALKKEISEDMKANHVCSPETPTFKKSEYNRRIDLYHKTGLSTNKFSLISEIEHYAEYAEDRKFAKQFLHKHNKSYSTDKTVLTTHPRGVFNEYNHSTLIFDEDPIQYIISTKSIGLTDLQKLLELNTDQQTSKLFEDLVLSCIKMNESTFKKVDRINVDINSVTKEIIEKGLSFNLVNFLRANHLYKNDGSINYCIHNPLPSDKKIAIMSATCNEYIYKKLYGDRVKIIDLSNTKITGNIIQHTAKSYSRTSLRDSIEEINNKVNGNPTITFKEFGDDVKGAVDDIYYGNTRGYNRLGGKDINVVGTPHLNNALYLLLAQAIGIDINNLDTAFNFQKIVYNGFEFKFNCFNAKELRDIQLQCIESELLQATGRARALRKDVTVHLYSNFPLKQAKYIHD